MHISFDIDYWNEYYKVHFKFYTRDELKKIFKKNIKDNSNYIYKIQRVKTTKEKKTEYESEDIQKKNCLMFWNSSD